MLFKNQVVVIFIDIFLFVPVVHCYREDLSIRDNTITKFIPSTNLSSNLVGRHGIDCMRKRIRCVTVSIWDSSTKYPCCLLFSCPVDARVELACLCTFFQPIQRNWPVCALFSNRYFNRSGRGRPFPSVPSPQSGRIFRTVVYALTLDNRSI
jgi:hypothetical protein